MNAQKYVILLNSKCYLTEFSVLNGFNGNFMPTTQITHDSSANVAYALRFSSKARAKSVASILKTCNKTTIAVFDIAKGETI